MKDKLVISFGDSFIHGIGAEEVHPNESSYFENGEHPIYRNISYYLKVVYDINVINRAIAGSTNEEIYYSVIKENYNIKDTDIYVVVGVTSFLRDTLPYIKKQVDWSNYHFDYGKTTDAGFVNEDIEVYKDYLAYIYDNEYFETLNKLFLVKLKYYLDGIDEVKDYIFLNTVESYKVPPFLEKNKFLYPNSSLTECYWNKNDTSLFENIESQRMTKGIHHLSSKGYSMVATDIYKKIFNGGVL